MYAARIHTIGHFSSRQHIIICDWRIRERRTYSSSRFLPTKCMFVRTTITQNVTCDVRYCSRRWSWYRRTNMLISTIFQCQFACTTECRMEVEISSITRLVENVLRQSAWKLLCNSQLNPLSFHFCANFQVRQERLVLRIFLPYEFISHICA